MRRVPIVALVALAAAPSCAAGAASRNFVIAQGNRPDVAIDTTDTVHIVWDTVHAGASTTHYCRIAWAKPGCVAGSERTFRPVPGDEDFGGPRVFVSGSAVQVVTSRCCTRAKGPDRRIHLTRVFRFVSANGGSTFGPAAWVGTVPPGLGAVLAADGSLLTLGPLVASIDHAGIGLQIARPPAFPQPARKLTSATSVSGGVGLSPAAAVVAFDDKRGRNVIAGAWAPGAGSLRTSRLAAGYDSHVDSGPLGPDVLYLAGGRSYVVRRYAGGSFGPAIPVSDPNAGEAALTQDSTGGMHVVWDAGFDVLYRASTPQGVFSKSRGLNTTGEFFHPHIAINAAGRVAVAYDGDSDSSQVGVILF